MKIKIRAALTFYEEDGTSTYLSPETRTLLQKQAEEEIRQEIKACITKSQSLNSDILGWGKIVNRDQPRQWENLKADWYTIFPNINSDIDVQVQLLRTGLTPQIFNFKE